MEHNINGYSEDGVQQMTLLDVIEYYIANPEGRMTQRSGTRKNFEYWAGQVKEWGGMRYSELTEKERKAHR